jgi:hypothetical protein
MRGIYREIVEATIQGTTLVPQFVYSIAKTIVGSKMAGHVEFEDLAAEPLEYLALCGAKGSGKGEAWRRVLAILEATATDSMPVTNTSVSCGAGIKIINSADSGAGIRDAFFEPPTEQPIICYVDEVSGLGHKSDGRKNPEILDRMVELADSTSISDVKAKKSAKRSSAKTKNNAFLAMVMCGQNSKIWTSAFVGKTDVGLFDRITPEHSLPVDAGNLPAIPREVAFHLQTRINKMFPEPVKGEQTKKIKMRMSDEASAEFDVFWACEPPEIRSNVRFRKHLKLDCYLIAFGQGRTVVDLQDLADAIKIFNRQLAIRRVMFRGEASDRIGFYLNLIKLQTEWMRRRLAEGIPAAKIACSRYDYETSSGARDRNEEHIFEQAWKIHSKHHLYIVPIKGGNGHIYERYLPVDFGD